jgi:2Fe-2S ferredoxin
MVQITVKTRSDETRSIDVSEGQSLMVALRDEGFDILGTCGGMCSCGSCHVIVSEKIAAQLPPPSEDERDMLDSLAEVVDVHPTSRLSCQVSISPILDQGDIEIGQEL